MQKKSVTKLVSRSPRKAPVKSSSGGSVKSKKKVTGARGWKTGQARRYTGSSEATQRLTTETPNKPAFEILIDDRELTHNDWMLPYLRHQFPAVKFSVERQTEGDFISPSVMVERKTIDDLWDSLLDGRFHDQSSRLMTYTDKVIIYLIVGSVDLWEFKYDGLYKAHKVPKAPDRNIIDSCIASLIVRHNFRVICDTNEKNGLKRMVRIMQKIEEGSLDLPSNRNHAMLAAVLTGISKTQVLELIKLYGTSLARWATLTKADLTKITGIGPAKADKFIKFFKEGW